MEILSGQVHVRVSRATHARGSPLSSGSEDFFFLGIRLVLGTLAWQQRPVGEGLRFLRGHT